MDHTSPPPPPSAGYMSANGEQYIPQVGREGEREREREREGERKREREREKRGREVEVGSTVGIYIYHV